MREVVGCDVLHSHLMRTKGSKRDRQTQRKTQSSCNDFAVDWSLNWWKHIQGSTALLRLGEICAQPVRTLTPFSLGKQVSEKDLGVQPRAAKQTQPLEVMDSSTYSGCFCRLWSALVFNNFRVSEFLTILHVKKKKKLNQTHTQKKEEPFSRIALSSKCQPLLVCHVRPRSDL